MKRIATLTLALVGPLVAFGEIDTQFAGYDTVYGIGTSGRHSSYAGDTHANLSISGTTIGSSLAAFGEDLVNYPRVGTLPSPGGADARTFDLGALGWQSSGADISFKLASGIDPRAGYYFNSAKNRYNVGDLFITVSDTAGVRHYALLNSWARDNDGAPLRLDRGRYDAAQNFHTNNGESREGALIELNDNGDVELTGGRRSYNRNNAPEGLDVRVFAKDGEERGEAALVHELLALDAQNWTTTTWTLPMDLLSDDDQFGISLHVTETCGNDSIGLTTVVPEPASLLLLAIGGAVCLAGRRSA